MTTVPVLSANRVARLERPFLKCLGVRRVEGSKAPGDHGLFPRVVPFQINFKSKQSKDPKEDQIIFVVDKSSKVSD